MAGRGFGKTRAGAEWVRGLAESGAARSLALVGDTEEDVRQVMVEGPSGILAVSPPASRPQWHRSLRRLDPMQQTVTALADRVRELDGETAGIRDLLQQNTL